MKSIHSILLSSVATVSLAASLVACGGYSSGSGTGGTPATGGTMAATGGSSPASGGSNTPATGGSNTPATGGSNTPATGGSNTPATGGSNAPATGGNNTPATGGSNTPATGGRAPATDASVPGLGGSAPATGGSGPATDASTPATGGNAPLTGGSVPGTGGTPPDGITLPADILNKATGNKCVAAHSTVRVIFPGYTGPLYEVCKGTANTGPSSCKGTKQDIGSKDGYADAAAQDTFCSGASCTITKIYDQSGMKNDLEPAPQGGVCGPDKPADAKSLPVTINGHAAYGVLIKAGIGYRTGCAGCTVKTGNGQVKGDDPESMYWVTSQKDLIDGCCFDYGNAETTSHDDGNGTMETLYFGGGVVWGTGYGGKPGPWMMADLENGLYAGWENKQDKNISTNKPLKYDFVTGILLGDTKDKNAGKGRFAIYGGDATTGTLQTMYDGIRPEKTGYVPMTKQGSIILGIGGDNSCGAGGRFYEGAISAGPVLTKETSDAIQAAIVAAKYGK